MSGAIEKNSHAAHRARVSFRPLFAILIALAMLIAPFALQSGSAMAAMPLDHHSQMMKKGHCGDQRVMGKASTSASKSCCVAMYTAVGVTPTSPIEPLAFSRMVEQPALEQFRHGYLAELATPPPRRA